MCDAKKMKNRLVLILFVLLSISLSAKTITGKVISVWDGDTIRLQSHNTIYKIRLDGIDCPELDQAYGRKARDYTSKLVMEKKVKVKLNGKDMYKRWLGEVFTVSGMSVNKALVRSGFAWQYYHNKDPELTKLQNLARTKKIGLWADPKPIPPWQFRKQKKK